MWENTRAPTEKKTARQAERNQSSPSLKGQGMNARRTSKQAYRASMKVHCEKWHFKKSTLNNLHNLCFIPQPVLPAAVSNVGSAVAPMDPCRILSALKILQFNFN